MAFFGKKKDSEPTAPAPGAPAAKAAPPPKASDDERIAFSPEQAARFFHHAKTVHDTANYEYAIQCWLDGLRYDPASIPGLEGFFASAAAFLSDSGGKKNLSKEITRSVSGKGDLDRYRYSLLDWALHPDDTSLAVRALEAAAKINLSAPALKIGDIALNRVVNDKRVRKDLLAKISMAFEKVGAFDRAVVAAEQAYKADPTDGEMSARIRALAAQATMARGGYEKAGEEGGFRANVRDADRQRQLDESERIVKTEQTIDRLISQAEKDLAARPQDLPSIEKLAKLLIERGRAADEERAFEIYMKGFAETRQFRFREFAGDIRIRQKRRQVSELSRMLEQAGDDDMVRRMHEQATRELLDLELDEFTLRVRQYPTDLTRKFELGRRSLAAGRTEDAIQLFQEAQNDPKNRAASLTYLGQAFAHQGWNDEAIETFRRALDLRDLSSDQVLDLKYHLMAALERRAQEASNLAAAEEAEKLAASIAVQQIGFRDIRTRRDAIKKLVGELRSRGG